MNSWGEGHFYVTHSTSPFLKFFYNTKKKGGDIEIIKKNPPITIKLGEKLVDQVNETMKQLGMENVSEFVRGSLMFRIRAEQMKSVIQDPQRLAEFITQMNEHLTEKDAFDWVATLSDTKLQGFKQLVEFENEKRENKFQKG